LRTAVLLLWPAGRTDAAVWMPCRADSLAIGMLAALLWRQGIIQSWYAAHRTAFYVILSVPVLGLARLHKVAVRHGCLLDGLARFFLARVLLCWFASLVSYWSPAGFGAVFLQWSFLREMGRLSYCIYLIHLLLLVSAMPCFAISALASLLLRLPQSLSSLFCSRSFSRSSPGISLSIP